MHSRFINRSWSLLLAGLGLTACVEDELVELADPGAEVELRGGTPNYPLIPCNSANVIGELHTPNDCSFPIPSDWEMHGLFTNYTPEILAWGETRPDALKKFCAFEYVGGTPIEYGDYIDLFDAIDQSMVMHVDTVEVDCFGQTMSGLETTEIDEEFATLYHDAIQWVSGDDLQSTQQYRVLPEIAILDTASQKSHKEETEPNNMHGFFMGDIAGDIACPDGDEDCLENIVFHVAMPRDEFEPADYEDGGHQGTMGDLATALVAAVGQWREVRLDDPSKTPRLVVSLSLGWDATLNDPDRAPVRALEMALNFAACNGAIVVAASGNSPDPECPLSGALAPATYSTKLAPSEQSCIAMGFEPIDDTNYPVFGVSRTLVLAVGGVDGYDQPIINARLDSTPMLVAYASNATVFSNGDYTTPLTGTSVSAAQVAGIAALIWSYVPEATPSWIMERLYWPNEDLGVDADLYLNINYRDVRRASVCNSLEMACPSGTSCPQLDCEAPRVLSHVDVFDAIDGAIQDPNNTVVSIMADEPEAPQCGPQEWDEQSKPQPEHPLCPECPIISLNDTIKDNDNLYIDIKPAYQGLVQSISLTTVNTNSNTQMFNLSSTVVDSVNNSAIDITQVTLDAPNTVSASLKFTLADGSTQDGPILVQRG